MRLGHLTIAAALAFAVAPDRTDAADATVIDLAGARILALSPDGQLVATREPADEAPERLCVHDVATMAERSCGDLDQTGVAMADDTVVWSPDSTTLAFSETSFATLRDGDLWTMDAATGTLTNVTDDGFEGDIPLLFSSTDTTSVPEEFFVDVLPAWAPDSASLAFSRSPVLDGEFSGNDVVTIEPDGGDVESLVSVSSDEAGVVYYGLAWAPDGERLYYSVTFPDLDDERNGVWAYDLSSGESTQLLASDPDTGPPALLRVAATGTTALVFYPLYWSTPAAGSREYFALVDLATGVTAPVDPTTDGEPTTVAEVATFSPDGTQVLYGQRTEGGGRLFVRDLPDGKPVELDAQIDGDPLTTPMGGGLFWGTDGTVFVATDLGAGALLHVSG